MNKSRPDFPGGITAGKSLAEFRALWARKGLGSFSAAACTSPKILLAQRASNCPPNGGQPRRRAKRRSPSAAGNPRRAECTSWERRSSEMTELPAKAESEGYAACDDDGGLYCKKGRRGLFYSHKSRPDFPGGICDCAINSSRRGVRSRPADGRTRGIQPGRWRRRGRGRSCGRPRPARLCGRSTWPPRCS